MATPNQLAANRANAQKSTGPTTDEGKTRSRRNALKHGLSGMGIVLPENLQDAVALYDEQLRPTTRPTTTYQRTLTTWMARDIVRVENIAARLEMRRCELAWRSLQHWDADRRDEALILAEDLTRRPTAVSTRLQRTPQGCRVLIEFWTMLRDTPQVWDDDQRGFALDLLGVPRHLRSGPTRLDVPAGADPVAHQKACAQVEIDRLETRASGAAAGRDRGERLAVQYGVSEVDREMRLLARYEREGMKRVLRYRELLAGEPEAAQAEVEAQIPLHIPAERSTPRLDTRPVLPDSGPATIPDADAELGPSETEDDLAPEPVNDVTRPLTAPIGSVAARPGG